MCCNEILKDCHVEEGVIVFQWVIQNLGFGPNPDKSLLKLEPSAKGEDDSRPSES